MKASVMKQERESVPSQLITFNVRGVMYGIDVSHVQEVGLLPALSKFPLAPSYIKGITNLRGQIAAAIDLSFFLEPNSTEPTEQMTLICRHKGTLMSFIVDDIGDVIEVDQDLIFENIDNPNSPASRMITGVYKLEHSLVNIFSIEKIFNHFKAQGV